MRFIWGALPPAERVYKQKICHEAYVLSEPALLAYLRLWLGGPWHFYRPQSHGPLFHYPLVISSTAGIIGVVIAAVVLYGLWKG